MPLDRGRAKKLIVAFHFHRSRQAGWKCDACRKNGLDRKRRCGFLKPEQRGPVVAVWTGGGVGVTECPKPIITSFSLMCLEGFFAVRLTGGGAATGGGTWSAAWGKVIDAWHVLDGELQKENHND
jgi:hypothetical protein